MINYIVGKLIEITNNTVIIENNNIAYELLIPTSNVRLLPNIGSEIKVYTYLVFKEDLISLYGFLTKEDREIYLKLITVNGVGPKGALNIISNFGYLSLIKIIKSSDANKIAEVPGIGKKTASKIIIELSDKIDKLNIDTNTSTNDNEYVIDENINKVITDTIDALCALGYQKKQANDLIKSLKFDNNISTDELLKLALRK